MMVIDFDAVRYGEDDKPDKYGWAQKQKDIMNVASECGDITKSGIPMNENDMAYFRVCVRECENARKESGGKDNKPIMYFND